METSKLHLENETRREVGVDPLPADTLLIVTLKLNDLKVVLRQGLSPAQLGDISGAVQHAVTREIIGDS